MFKSAKPNTMSQNIVEQVRQAIFEGRIKPGDKLPSEKDLIKKFNVSRVSLREALRSLEMLGFLEIRKGTSGGAFVTEVDMIKTRKSFANFLIFKNLSLEDLTAVRLILESYSSEKAARMITKEDLKRLEKLIEKFNYDLQNNVPIGSLNRQIEFHQIIGGVTGNPILAFILEFVIDLLIGAKEILQPSREFYEDVLRAHKRIYKAILEKNAKIAREEMVKHIRQEEKYLLKLQEKRLLKGLNPIDFTSWNSMISYGSGSEK